MRIDRRDFLVASGVALGLPKPKMRTVDTVGTSMNALRAVDLRADYIDKPLGLENITPRLSWRLDSHLHNSRQSAYRIWVASCETRLIPGRADLWDSGKVYSTKTIGIPYKGRSPDARQRCFWCVQVWNERGELSAPSPPSWWEMGLLQESEWAARWLAAEDEMARADRQAGLRWIWGQPTRDKVIRGFRAKFSLPMASTGGEFFATVNDYTLFAQITRVWIDGIPIAGRGTWSDEAPWTEDLELPLRPLEIGEHSLAIQVNTHALPPYLANSDFEHAFAVFLRLSLRDGSTLRLGCDLQWKTSLTPENDWHSPGYDDGEWETARVVPLPLQPWPSQPAMCLRHEFSIEQPVKKARLYATALGAYEAHINGHRVSDVLLTPDRSAYEKRLLYQVFDVTDRLSIGANVLGFLVGDGWYGHFDRGYPWGAPPRRVLGQLELTLADGSRQTVLTGPGWRITKSAIRKSQIRLGEVYDARYFQPGWDNVGFDDSQWVDAQPGNTPSCRLVAQTTDPIRSTQRLKPRTISQPVSGVYVFDFGQNFAGWCRLHATTAPGTRIELKFGELLAKSGEVDQPFSGIGEPKIDTFISRGDADAETFEPHFTYRGFRYVQVSGLPTTPSLDSLEGVVVHTDFKFTGRLRVSVPVIEQIWEASVWTRRSNFVGVPTDCSGREQRGYLESSALCWDDVTFNMDVCALTSRLMENIVDQQAEDGAFPISAPTPPLIDAIDHIPGSNPGHSDAGIILPWIAWQRYGDLSIVERNWESMNRYLQFVLNHNPDYVGKNGHALDWGDYLSLGQLEPNSGLPETPKDLIGTAYWAYTADLLSQMADAIGRASDADRLRSISGRVRRAFNRAFVKLDGTIGTGSQTGYALALRFDLLPEGSKRAAAERLAADVRKRGVALTTGILGTCHILDALTDGGFPDLAYGLLLRTDYPSWGYMIREGATTIWEMWNGVHGVRKSDGTIETFTPALNHSDLASISGFLFRRIAGINAATPGFDTIRIRPVLDPRIKRGGGDYDSVKGRISTDWSQNSDFSFSLSVTLPANTSAFVHLPVNGSAQIKERQRDITHSEVISLVTRSASEAVLRVGSGTYDFTVAAS